MSWTGAKELKAQLTRLWERGDLLRDAVTGNGRFPLRLTLRTPASADITDRFDVVRIWVAELSSVGGLRLEWQDVRHRIQGSQRLPTTAWVDTVDDALAWLGKRPAWDRFLTLVSATRTANPALLRWLERRPLLALELADDWARLLAVVSWLVANPRPGIYLRQVDLSGVHSKFIEAHRRVLAELLDLALPSTAVDVTKSGVNDFAGRYGFLEKPTRVRFRILDAQLRLLPGMSYPDITLDADSFSNLSLAVKRIFITENETNFLALPPVKLAIVIFGAGYGWEALARSGWLSRCTIHYWGDIDTHGFAILNQLRSNFPNVNSFLMDRATLAAHETFWGSEDTPLQTNLSNLNPDEAALYDDLRDNRIRKSLRLEQEHIGFHWLNLGLQDLLADQD